MGCLGGDKVTTEEPLWRTRALRRRDTKEISFSPLCEDTARWQSSENPKKVFHQNLAVLVPRPCTYQPLELCERSFRCLTHPVHGNLLKQPKPSKAQLRKLWHRKLPPTTLVLECLCPPQIHMLKQTLQCEVDALGRWLSHNNEVLINGISVLKEEVPKISRAPSTKWGHSRKMTIGNYEAGLTRHQISWWLDLELPRAQKCEK